MTEIGCMGHARREFVELHAINKSMIATFSFQLYSSSPGYTAHESSLAAYDGLQPGHHGFMPFTFRASPRGFSRVAQNEEEIALHPPHL